MILYGHPLYRQCDVKAFVKLQWRQLEEEKKSCVCLLVSPLCINRDSSNWFNSLHKLKPTEKLILLFRAGCVDENWIFSLVATDPDLIQYTEVKFMNREV